MKKIFTLIIALMGFVGVANAATVNDIKVCQHSYVFNCATYAEVGRSKANLFADGFFLDVTGGSVGTKGCVNAFEKLGDAYADYNTTPTKSLRLKKAQDVIAMRITAGSKLIILGESHASRSPEVNNQADMKGTDIDFYLENTKDTEGKFEWTAPDDMLIYIGSHGGDYYFSWIIVEAKEAPGTPTIKVGAQTFDNGLWYREVTCKPNDMIEEGSTESIPTIVTYTTDGSTPTATSPVYKEPIKCYQNTTIKFQAYMNLFGDGNFSEEDICTGTDYEVGVNFQFDAPTIEIDGAKFTIVSPYAEQNGKNFFTLSANGQTTEAVEGDGTTLDLSATVTAYTEIINGNYGKFTSFSTSKDVYVLNPIKEKKTIAIASADVVVDDEATAASTDGTTVYKVENGSLTADKKDFFVKNLTFGVLKDAKAQYQVPEGQEAYIQMSNTNIVFKVAAGDKVKVKVVCSKNSCKNLDADDAAEDKLDNGCTPDRQCYVNVSGTNYCLTDAEGKHTNDLKLYPNANEFEFELAGGKTTKQNVKDAEGNDVLGEDGKALQEEVFTAGDTYYTFQKYSGTGNILISSIEIEPAGTAGIAAVKAVNAQSSVLYNLAGQRVDANYKGIVVKNGAKMIQK